MLVQELTPVVVRVAEAEQVLQDLPQLQRVEAMTERVDLQAVETTLTTATIAQDPEARQQEIRALAPARREVIAITEAQILVTAILLIAEGTQEAVLHHHTALAEAAVLLAEAILLLVGLPLVVTIPEAHLQAAADHPEVQEVAHLEVDRVHRLAVEEDNNTSITTHNFI